MEKKTARDVMTSNVLTVFDELPVAELARMLTENGVSGAPVIDKRNKLCGVVSMSDIVSHELKVGHVVVSESEYYARPEIASRREMRELGIHIEDYGDSLVRDIMTPVVISVGPSAAVAEVAEKMAVNKVHRVLITEGDTIHGVISALDLVGLVPAAAVRGAGGGEILWATDLGPSAEHVGSRAVALAISTSARVAALHVTPNLSTLMKAYGERPELGDLQKGFEETALGKLQDLGRKLLDGAIEFEIMGRSGNPAEVIRAVIAERRPAFVVIGAQRPPEARLPGLGSVAKKVLASSLVPVVIVPPE